MSEEREITINLTKEEKEALLLILQKHIVEKLQSNNKHKTASCKGSLKFTCERYMNALSQCHPEYCLFAEHVLHGVPKTVVDSIISVLHDKVNHNIPLQNREEKRDSLCRLLYGCLHYEDVFSKIHEFKFERNPTLHVFDNERQIRDHKLSQRTKIEAYKRAIAISSNQFFNEFPHISALCTFTFNNSKFYFLFSLVKQSKNQRYILYDNYNILSDITESTQDDQEEENLVALDESAIASSPICFDEYKCRFSQEEGYKSFSVFNVTNDRFNHYDSGYEDAKVEILNSFDEWI